nr:translational initiation factor 1 [Pueraria candollei var. mirifica]
MLLIGYVSKKIRRTFYGYTIRKEKKYKSVNLIRVFFNLNILFMGKATIRSSKRKETLFSSNK